MVQKILKLTFQKISRLTNIFSSVTKKALVQIMFLKIVYLFQWLSLVNQHFFDRVLINTELIYFNELIFYIETL